MGSVALSRERRVLSQSVHKRSFSEFWKKKEKENRTELCFEKKESRRKIFLVLDAALHSSSTTTKRCRRQAQGKKDAFYRFLLHTMSLRLALYQEHKAWRPGEMFRATLEVIQREREWSFFWRALKFCDATAKFPSLSLSLSRFLAEALSPPRFLLSVVVTTLLIASWHTENGYQGSSLTFLSQRLALSLAQ